jgi:hypothetical protein
MSAPMSAPMSASVARASSVARTLLAVPAYVHPSVDPDVWIRLAEAAADLRFVIVNVDSGPGQDVDPAYPGVVERLRAAGARMVGYVDTDYGRVGVADIAAQARLWVTRYGVRGVFLDQVAADFAHLEYYAACALAARAAGAQFVVMNPGTNCHPAYAEIANVTVTFEGTWQDYLHYRPTAAIKALPAQRFCHLVHEVPTGRLAGGAAMPRGRHAGSALFTDGAGSNPWDRLPQAFVEACASVDGSGRRPAARADDLARRWGERRYATT